MEYFGRQARQPWPWGWWTSSLFLRQDLINNPQTGHSSVESCLFKLRFVNAAGINTWSIFEDTLRWHRLQISVWERHYMWQWQIIASDGNLPVHCRIQGRRGWTHQKFFIFMYFLENWPNNRLVPPPFRVGTQVWEFLESPLLVSVKKGCILPVLLDFASWPSFYECSLYFKIWNLSKVVV